MEAQTIQRYIHTSPRKLRLVADMVRKMEPNRALDVLNLTPKYAAKDLAKALETVLANAKVSGMDLGNLQFAKLEIDESMKMRRFRAGTRGRTKPYKKRMSHIRIVVTDEMSAKGKVQSAKSTEPEPVKGTVTETQDKPKKKVQRKEKADK